MHTYSEPMLKRHVLIHFVIVPVLGLTILAVALLYAVSLSYKQQLDTIKLDVAKKIVQQHYDTLISTPKIGFQQLSDILISSGHVKSIALLNKDKEIIDSAGTLLMQVDLDIKNTNTFPIFKNIDTTSIPTIYIAMIVTPSTLPSPIQTRLYLSYALIFILFIIGILYYLHSVNSGLLKPFRKLHRTIDKHLPLVARQPSQVQKASTIISFINEINNILPKKTEEEEKNKKIMEETKKGLKQALNQEEEKTNKKHILLKKIEEKLTLPINTILGRIEVLKKSENNDSNEHIAAITLAAEELLNTSNLLSEQLYPERGTLTGSDEHKEPNKTLKKDSFQALLVDDNPANLKLLEALLDRFNIQCDLTDSGMTALEALGQKTYDIVLMDLNMPEINGIEAIGIYRKTETANRRTPVIAVSASTVEEQKKNLLTAGFDDYLGKPISEKMLSNTLQRWLDDSPIICEKFITAPSHDQQINNDTTFELKSNKGEIIKQRKKTPIVDRSLSLTRANNNIQLAKDMLIMLLDMLPESLKKIEHYLETENYELLGEEAHKIHGGACYCGSMSLQRSSGELDTEIKQGEIADSVKIRTLTIDLKNDINSLINWQKGQDIHIFFDSSGSS